MLLSFYLLRFISLNPLNLLQIPETRKALSLTPAPSFERIDNLLRLVVDFGNGKTIKYQKELLPKSPLNALSFLEEASQNKIFKLEIKKYDFGTFVQSIDDYQTSSEKAWILFVNGQASKVAADKFELKLGDYVEWKYIVPSE